MQESIKTFVKPSAFLGAVIGLILGVLLVIPVIQLFVVFLFFAIGAVVILLLKQNHFSEKYSQKDGCIIGGVSGFVSVITASVSFSVLALIFGSIFNGTYDLIKAFFGSFSSFVVLLILIFCIALMNLIFNMGSALLVVSLYEGTKNNNSTPKFEVEEKEWKRF